MLTSSTPAARPAASRRITRISTAIMAMGMIAVATGCFIPIYSARPERRIQQLLYDSENFRAMADTWERFWFTDQPSHLTPVRVHGGVL